MNTCMWNLNKVSHTALKLLLFIIFFSSSGVTFAESQRPKVGLVLGGGGAAGTAHVGVLKVLEENHIPIDMIAGTSMGAIVGSLYASGVKAQELEQIVNTLDWEAIFNDQVSRREQGFHRKRDMSSFFDSFTMGANRHSVKLPRGAVKGHKLTFELRRLLDHVSHINHFDQLSIPFRAVATDIENGQEVVLSQGNLATAVRASMSIPALFPPVEINGRLLVDGFVSNNIPVSVAQNMGADILIVVGLPRKFKQKKELHSAVDVALQSMYLMMAKSSLPQLNNIPQPHVVLLPDMKGIESLSFDRVQEAVTIGEAQARRQLPALLKLTQPVRGKGGAVVAQATKREAFKGVIEKIVIENDSVLSDAILQRRLGLNIGDTLSLERLQKGLDAIYALGYFEVVDYRLAPHNDGAYTLVVSAQKDPLGNQTLQGGFSLSDDFDGDAAYQAGLELTLKGLNSLGGELKGSVAVGDSLAVSADYFQPLNTHGSHFLNPRVTHKAHDFYVYGNQGKTRLAEARITESSLVFDVGREVSNIAESRVGLFYRVLEPELKVGQLNLPAAKFNLAGVKLEYHKDTLDDRNFPDQGEWLDASYEYGSQALGSDVSYHRLSVEKGKAWQKDKHHVIASASGGSTLSDSTLITERFALGGFAKLSGLKNDQLRGNHYLHGLGAYYYDFASIPKFASLKTGFMVEAGNTWNHSSDIDPSDAILSAAAFVGAKTLIGPAYVGVGVTDNTEPRYFFQFGRAF